MIKIFPFLFHAVIADQASLLQKKVRLGELESRLNGILIDSNLNSTSGSSLSDELRDLISSNKKQENSTEAITDRNVEEFKKQNLTKQQVVFKKEKCFGK